MEVSTIQDVIRNQMSIPMKLLTNYKSLGLNEQEVMLILQIYRFIHINVDFPTFSELSKYVTMHEKECATILRKLIQKQFLSIEQLRNDKNQISEAYSLNPLWEKLFLSEKTQYPDEEQVGTIFILFEQEFGRPLSPFEIETINDWLDNDRFYPSLIKAALRESVLMGKLNFTYIDRILRNWKKKGIQTVEQARQSSRKFRDNQAKRTYDIKREKSDASLYYNWLEEEQ